MPTIQISKIQVRSGNIADLPQLDSGEIALALDLTTPDKPQNRLFFGPSVPVYTNSSPSSNNIEILSQFSALDFVNVVEADAANTNMYYPIMGNLVSGSLTLWANSNLSFDIPSGTLYSTELNVSNSGVIGNNLIVGGNLIVDGNLAYLNVETLVIEDPLIQQGTGPNGTPVPAADIKDRGAIYHFYNDGVTDNLRFNGWDSSASEFIVASDVTLNVNETVTVNQYGNTRALNGVYNGDLAVNGGDLTSNQSTFNLLNTTPTTIIFGDTAARVDIGATTGNTNIKSNAYIAGNANITGRANISNTTAATSTTTGALIVAGGAGIAGNAYIGGNANVTGNANITGNITVVSTTAATSTTTGATIIAGGLGVAGNIYFGGNIVGGNFVVPGANTEVLFNDSLLMNANASFTFDKVSGNVAAKSFVSTVAVGTPPFGVTSTTRVSSLYVQGANEANIQPQTAGTQYLNFTTATSGNLAIGANAAFNVDVSTGVLYAPEFSGNFASPGNDSEVIYNDGGIMNSQPGFTFNDTTSNVSIAGNVIIAGTFISSLATGTAPIAVTSTTRVINLHVENSLESEVTLTSAGTYYLDLVPATNGNIQHYANAALSFDATTGVLSATGFTGNVVAPGSDTQVIFNDAGVMNAVAGLTFNKATGDVVAGRDITATRTLISQVATGTAPLTVTSTTRVTNLHVENSLESEVTLTSAGTYYLDLLPATNGNIQHYSNASLTYDVTNGNLKSPILQTTTLTTGAAATAGTITGTWSLSPGSSLQLSPGSSLQATYADLAEYYVSDAKYEPGTVVEFGGKYEITIAEDETMRVAGIVSTAPAYVMNSNIEGEFTLPIALAGRVPCKVRGRIRKGDMMISGGNGYARPTHSPKMGTIIGKSLEDFEGEGIIEIVVGRL